MRAWPACVCMSMIMAIRLARRGTCAQVRSVARSCATHAARAARTCGGGAALPHLHGLRRFRMFSQIQTRHPAAGQSSRARAAECDMDGGTDGRRITIHRPEDFAGMRAAGRLAAETLDMVTDHIRPGMTT